MGRTEQWTTLRTLVCVRPSGDRVTVTAKIGQPYAWGRSVKCPVKLEPLDDLPDVAGADAWQAIRLSMWLMEQELRQEVERGSKLF